MTTLAVTGHMNLTDSSRPLVARALAEAITAARGDGDLVGYSCLARGSDSLFADEVVKAGGRLHVILPSQDYRERKVKPDHAPDFDRLTSQAAEVEVLPFATADRAAYEAANAVLLDRADTLVAVWDGQGADARGGTAHLVALARERGVPVVVVWPEGAARST